MWGLTLRGRVTTPHHTDPEKTMTTRTVTPTASAAQEAADRPNVVVIMVDDLGWPQLGSYGNTFNETPNIDRLASGGTRFTEAYAAAPVCSPTRASLMTGKYPARTGITNWLGPSGSNHLSPGQVTLPGRLRDAGYTLGLVGKWHLTEQYAGPYRERKGNPFDHGFDQVRVSETQYIGDGDYWPPYAFAPGVQPRHADEYLTGRLGEEGNEFVQQQRDRAFLLYLAHYAVHTKLDARPEFVAEFRRKTGAGSGGRNPVLAAMLTSIDIQVGALMATLDRLGLTDQTYVIVTSDNGGEVAASPNTPLRGGKWTLYEGGIRVPFIVRGPGVRSGVTSEVPIHTADIMPTLLELAGAGAPPAGTDGRSLAPLLRGTGRPEREALYWYYPHTATPMAAVREGNDKLVLFLETGRVELYDVRTDPGETRDRATAEPRRAQALRRLLDAHLHEVP